jgi:hypothetical protein
LRAHAIYVVVDLVIVAHKEKVDQAYEWYSSARTEIDGRVDRCLKAASSDRLFVAGALETMRLMGEKFLNKCRNDYRAPLMENLASEPVDALYRNCVAKGASKQWRKRVEALIKNTFLKFLASLEEEKVLLEEIFRSKMFASSDLSTCSSAQVVVATCKIIV